MYNIQISKYPNIQISKYPKLSKNLLKFIFSALFLCAVTYDAYSGSCNCGENTVWADASYIESNPGWQFLRGLADTCEDCQSWCSQSPQLQDGFVFNYPGDAQIGQPSWQCYGDVNKSSRCNCCHDGDKCDPTATRHSQTGAPKAVSTPKTKSAVNKPSQK